MKSQLDSYSMLIVMRYVNSMKDIGNIIMTNSKFEHSLFKLHFNPVPLTEKSKTLFPKLETVHYYSEEETKILRRCARKVFWYEVPFHRVIDNPFYQYKNIVITNVAIDISELSKHLQDGVLIVPKTVKSIKQGVLNNLKGDKFSKLVFPEEMKSLEKGILANCRFTEVVLPSSLTEIEEGFFSNCHQIKKLILPNSLRKIPNNCFVGCGITELVIPNSVTEIGEKAFAGLQLRSIRLSDGLTKLGRYSFASCNQLQFLKLPASLKVIETGAFYKCSNLKALSIPMKVQSIGEDCFKGCALLSQIIISRNVPSIGFGAFDKCPKLKFVFSN